MRCGSMVEKGAAKLGLHTSITPSSFGEGQVVERTWLLPQQLCAKPDMRHAAEVSRKYHIIHAEKRMARLGNRVDASRAC